MWHVSPGYNQRQPPSTKQTNKRTNRITKQTTTTDNSHQIKPHEKPQRFVFWRYIRFCFSWSGTRITSSVIFPYFLFLKFRTRPSWVFVFSSDYVFCLQSSDVKVRNLFRQPSFGAAFPKFYLFQFQG